jgi:tricorn protease-like protein
MLGGDIVHYDPNTDKLERLKQTIDGKALTKDSNLANPDNTLSYFANFAIRPFGPTAQPSPVEVKPTLL